MSTAPDIGNFKEKRSRVPTLLYAGVLTAGAAWLAAFPLWSKWFEPSPEEQVTSIDDVIAYEIAREARGEAPDPVSWIYTDDYSSLTGAEFIVVDYRQEASPFPTWKGTIDKLKEELDQFTYNMPDKTPLDISDLFKNVEVDASDVSFMIVNSDKFPNLPTMEGFTIYQFDENNGWTTQLDWNFRSNFDLLPKVHEIVFGIYQYPEDTELVSRFDDDSATVALYIDDRSKWDDSFNILRLLATDRLDGFTPLPNQFVGGWFATLDRSNRGDRIIYQQLHGRSGRQNSDILTTRRKSMMDHGLGYFVRGMIGFDFDDPVSKELYGSIDTIRSNIRYLTQNEDLIQEVKQFWVDHNMEPEEFDQVLYKRPTAEFKGIDLKRLSRIINVALESDLDPDDLQRVVETKRAITAARSNHTIDLVTANFTPEELAIFRSHGLYGQESTWWETNISTDLMGVRDDLLVPPARLDTYDAWMDMARDHSIDSFLMTDEDFNAAINAWEINHPTQKNDIARLAAYRTKWKDFDGTIYRADNDPRLLIGKRFLDIEGDRTEGNTIHIYIGGSHFSMEHPSSTFVNVGYVMAQIKTLREQYSDVNFDVSFVELPAPIAFSMPNEDFAGAEALADYWDIPFYRPQILVFDKTSFDDDMYRPAIVGLFEDKMADLGNHLKTNYSQ